MSYKFILGLVLVISQVSWGQVSFPLSPQAKNPQNFNKILSLAYKKISHVYYQQDLKLRIHANWADHDENAIAHPIISDRAVIEVHGGLYRIPTLTNDGFLMILCHEFGHHLGGKPRKPYHISVEGQADYFAAHACMPIMFADQDNAAYLKKNPVGIEIIQKCNRVWGRFTPRSLICQRTLAASVSVAASVKLTKELMPHLSEKDQTITGYTLLSHPPAQCRLDTMVAGALCTTERDRGMNRGQVCSVAQAMEKKAIRPACWFYYPQLSN